MSNQAPIFIRPFILSFKFVCGIEHTSSPVLSIIENVLFKNMKAICLPIT